MALATISSRISDSIRPPLPPFVHSSYRRAPLHQAIFCHYNQGVFESKRGLDTSESFGLRINVRAVDWNRSSGHQSGGWARACWGSARPSEWSTTMHWSFVEEFAAELLEIESHVGLEETLKRACQCLGFDHFALTLEVRTRCENPPEVLLHDYPEEWAHVYVDFDLGGRDPVRRACDKSFAGFPWEEIANLIPMTGGDRQMLAVGRECGIGDGYTVPRHLPGMARGTCSFVVRPDNALPTPTLAVAEHVGTLALSCALKTSGIARKASAPRLSDRQRECLLWAARGKTAPEIAIILGISPETVNQHLKTARARYEVHCRESLILCALYDGLIGFGDVIRWQSYN